MTPDKDGRTKKKKKTAVEKTTSKKIDDQEDSAVDNVDIKRKKWRSDVNDDGKEFKNSVTKKKKSNETTVEKTICEDMDGQQESVVENDDKKRRKRRVAYADAKEVTDQGLNNEKRRKCNSEPRSITANIDLSGEGKAEDDGVMSNKTSNAITAGVSKEMDDREEPSASPLLPDDTVYEKKRLRGARSRKKKPSRQNDTIEKPADEMLEMSGLDNSFRYETIEHGRQGGKIAVPGKKVIVEYIGKLKDGTVIEDPGYPVTFVLGSGEVMDGWDIGINGMRVGEVRNLRIPPAMGFGAIKIGKAPPNSTLHFKVKLINVRDDV